jgi:ankyrin repeat protein
VDTLRATENGLNLLHLAAVNNHTAIVKLILGKSPSLVNSANKLGQTPLHLAAAQKHLEVIWTLLIDGKADINAR